MRGKLFGFILIACMISWPVAPAMADEFHYTNYLIGDRASGMGGAYTAISDDPSGLYYNPAGTAYSQGRSLSASVNAYYSLTKKYENVIGGNGWERNSTSLLPNFFGVIQPVGSVKVGFSYAVPDSIQEYQDQVFYNLPSKFAGITATRYGIIFKNEDTTYNFGPSVAMELTRDLAAGFTLYYHQRTHLQSMKQLINLSNGKYEQTLSNYELNESGLRPIAGFMWSPFDKMTVGLSASRTMLMNSTTITRDTYKDSNYYGNTLTVEDGVTNVKREYPLQVRGGVAYFASNSLLFALDGAWYGKVNAPGADQRTSVFNSAIGMEYYYTRNWALRAGLFTDMANTPDINTERWGQAEQIDIYGGTLSVSHFTRNTSITLGSGVSQGNGKAQMLAGQTETQNVKLSAWMLFLSSSYSY